MNFLSGHNISSVACAAMLPFGTLLQQPVPTEVVYKHTAQGDLQLFCFQPTDDKSKGACPAAVWIHGGGWTGGPANRFFQWRATPRRVERQVLSWNTGW